MAGGPPDDCYALLGVDPDADRAAVRRAWRLLALRWHPDRAGVAATATFQRIQAAYVVLADPLARAAYDRLRGTAMPSGRRTPGAMLARLCGPLNALVACGIARVVDDDLIELVLLADEAAQGGMVTISMRVRVRAGAGTSDELYSAWLAIPPGVTDGTMLAPTVLLRGMVRPLRFRIRVA
jgi:curved DNA-binding protein CbpA